MAGLEWQQDTRALEDLNLGHPSDTEAAQVQGLDTGVHLANREHMALVHHSAHQGRRQAVSFLVAHLEVGPAQIALVLRDSHTLVALSPAGLSSAEPEKMIMPWFW